MQLPILRSLAMVAVGNAALAGRDVKGFGPNDPLFRYTAALDFMTPGDADQLKRAAASPTGWFEKLRRRECKGLRLHNAPMAQKQRLGHIEERMLVGFVGGGPRWLIETVYGDHSELWEGFDRIGDQKAPNQKIWLSAYILIGEAESAPSVDTDVIAAAGALRSALFAIEPLARQIPNAPFADIFVAARAALDGKDSEPAPDFVRYAGLKPEAERLLRAAGRAWVFGGMGSWNDMAVDPSLKAKYDETSAALFAALQRAVLVTANSTYRG